MEDLSDFEAHVRRHFFVDCLSGSDIQELYAEWLAMLANKWFLAPDGGLDTSDPEHAGWTWRVHRLKFDQLWFGPERRPTQQKRLIIRRDGDHVHLSIPSGRRGHEIWRVTS